jgi:hypothetical protein
LPAEEFDQEFDDHVRCIRFVYDREPCRDFESENILSGCRLQGRNMLEKVIIVFGYDPDTETGVTRRKYILMSWLTTFSWLAAGSMAAKYRGEGRRVQYLQLGIHGVHSSLEYSYQGDPKFRIDNLLTKEKVAERELRNLSEYKSPIIEDDVDVGHRKGAVSTWELLNSNFGTSPSWTSVVVAS